MFKQSNYKYIFNQLCCFDHYLGKVSTSVIFKINVFKINLKNWNKTTKLDICEWIFPLTMFEALEFF